MGRTITTGKIEKVEKIWLSGEEARAYLGCTERFLRTLREKAEVAYTKYGKTIWYDLRSIDRFLNRNMVVK